MYQATYKGILEALRDNGREVLRLNYGSNTDYYRACQAAAELENRFAFHAMDATPQVLNEIADTFEAMAFRTTLKQKQVALTDLAALMRHNAKKASFNQLFAPAA